MPEQSGLIEIVEFMSGAIEKGQKFWEFFGPQQPTAETITAAFAAEVQQIFTTGTAQGDVTKAQSDLDAAQHFLANGGDYANAVKNGETNAQLIGHMDGTDGPPLFALNSHADTMNGWVQNPGLVGWDVINKAATLYLALQTYLCTIHRERARISDDEKEKKTQLDDATNAARTAFATSFGLTGAHDPLWTEKGMPARADFLLWLSGDAAEDYLLVQEYSYDMAGELRDFRREETHLDELLAHRRLIETRGVFAPRITHTNQLERN